MRFFSFSHLHALFMASALVAPAAAVELSGQVYARHEMLGEITCGPIGEFLIKRASLTAGSDLGGNLAVEIEVETRPDEVYLKDCIISWSPLDYLELTAGLFKKPFCMATSTSNWNLLSVERPLIHDLAGDLGYSDRSTGAMVELSSPVPLQSTLSLGVFNGPGNEREKMYTASIEFEPVAALTMGGALSSLRLGEYDPMLPSGYASSGSMQAFSAFLRLDQPVTFSTRLELDAEYVAGDNWDEADVIYGETPPGFRGYWASGVLEQRLGSVPGIRSIEAGVSWSVLAPEVDGSDEESFVAPLIGVWMTSRTRLRFTMINRSFQDDSRDDCTDYITELGVRF